MLKCLLDTGASGSLVAKQHVTKLRLKKTPGPQTVWTTPGGQLQTTNKCQSTLFILPEFFRDRVIEWDLHVSSSLGAYDMIIGQDILSAQRIQFDFLSNSIRWEQARVPMKDSTGNFKETFHLEDPTKVVQDASS